MSPTFETTVLQAPGLKATGLPIPQAVVEALGTSRKPAVVVTIGDYSYRTTVGVRYGGFIVPLSAEHRARCALAAGDEVTVSLELDTQPRTTEIPDDLARRLELHQGLRSNFDALAPSRRAALVTGIEQAKTAETRERRIAAVIELLEGPSSG